MGCRGSRLSDLPRRWGERPSAARSRFTWLCRFPFGRGSASVAVTHLVLVRPMSRLFILVALLFTGCAIRVALDGRYAATISQADVEEIKGLVAGFEGGRYEFIGITAYAFHPRSAPFSSVSAEGRSRCCDANHLTKRWSERRTAP